MVQIKEKKKPKNLGVTTSTPEFFLNLKKSLPGKDIKEREREKN